MLRPAALLTLTLLAGCDDYLLPTGGGTTDTSGTTRTDTVLGLTGDPVAGETTFGSTCQVCHPDGGTTAGAGPALDTLVPTKTDAEIVDTMLNGYKTMPKQGSHLTDQESADVLAFLRQQFGP